MNQKQFMDDNKARIFMASQIDEISPKEWNNVPICVTDFLQQVLKYIFLDCRHNSYLEKSCEELA